MTTAMAMAQTSSAETMACQSFEQTPSRDGLGNGDGDDGSIVQSKQDEPASLVSAPPGILVALSSVATGLYAPRQGARLKCHPGRTMRTKSVQTISFEIWQHKAWPDAPLPYRTTASFADRPPSQKVGNDLFDASSKEARLVGANLAYLYWIRSSAMQGSLNRNLPSV